ncbi:hypothetical protein, partial [Streptomyces sp. sk226]|uniref:hypothetical protein n=1 Tax=Streptomyces sp. sk226 TaxID=2034268 RepID=UPI001C54C1A6
MNNSRKITPIRIEVLARITIQPRLHDLGRDVKMAQSEDFLLELIEPAYPKYLDEFEEYFSHYSASAPEGLVRALHGPYIDIAVHTADREIREASRRRVERSLAWARHILIRNGLSSGSLGGCERSGGGRAALVAVGAGGS